MRFTRRGSEYSHLLAVDSSANASDCFQIRSIQSAFLTSRFTHKDPCHETSPAVRFAPPLCETTVGDGRTPRFHCGKAPSGLCEEEEKQQQESRGVERESPHARGAGMIAAPALLEGSSSTTRGCSRRATAEITADTITPSPPLAQPLQSPRRRR
ncbi:unnamed protein product [Lampetra fluviatilis]